MCCADGNSDGTHTTTYTYDSANQLIRENNQSADKIWLYTYDNAGNLQSKTEYLYTTETLGEALDTVTYNYGDEAWGDLLTGYDGNTITHDTIGNPLTDGQWSYTWEHGRELAEITGSSPDGSRDITVTYTYDANGMRVGKTVVTEHYHTHSYTPIVTEPTCTEAGYTTYTCTCGDSYTESIPATGHSYTLEVLYEPTCWEKGCRYFKLLTPTGEQVEFCQVL